MSEQSDGGISAGSGSEGGGESQGSTGSQDHSLGSAEGGNEGGGESQGSTGSQDHSLGSAEGGNEGGGESQGASGSQDQDQQDEAEQDQEQQDQVAPDHEDQQDEAEQDQEQQDQVAPDHEDQQDQAEQDQEQQDQEQQDQAEPDHEEQQDQAEPDQEQQDQAEPDHEEQQDQAEQDQEQQDQAEPDQEQQDQAEPDHEDQQHQAEPDHEDQQHQAEPDHEESDQALGRDAEPLRSLGSAEALDHPGVGPSPRLEGPSRLGSAEPRGAEPDRAADGVDRGDRANERYAKGFDTPAGRAYSEPGDPVRGPQERLAPMPGVYTLDAHGNPDAVFIGGEPLSPGELADVIRADPNWGGQPVRLFSCETGKSPADGGPTYAQRLSDELGVPVIAPTELAWSNGHPFVASGEPGPDGSIKPTNPPDGEFAIFSPTSDSGPGSPDGGTPPTQRDEAPTGYERTNDEARTPGTTEGGLPEAANRDAGETVDHQRGHAAGDAPHDGAGSGAGDAAKDGSPPPKGPLGDDGPNNAGPPNPPDGNGPARDEPDGFISLDPKDPSHEHPRGDDGPAIHRIEDGSWLEHDGTSWTHHAGAERARSGDKPEVERGHQDWIRPESLSGVSPFDVDVEGPVDVDVEGPVDPARAQAAKDQLADYAPISKDGFNEQPTIKHYTNESLQDLGRNSGAPGDVFVGRMAGDGSWPVGDFGFLGARDADGMLHIQSGDGSWTPIRDEQTFRDVLAVPEEWNGDQNYDEWRLGDDGIVGCEGTAAPVEGGAAGPRPGGAKQILVPKSEQERIRAVRANPCFRE